MEVLDIERCVTQLGGGFKYFLCSPLLEEIIKFDLYYSNGDV